jgi:hypothetical protein
LKKNTDKLYWSFSSSIIAILHGAQQVCNNNFFINI